MDTMTALQSVHSESLGFWVREVLVWKQALREPGWLLALGSAVHMEHFLEQSPPASVHIALGAGVAITYSAIPACMGFLGKVFVGLEVSVVAFFHWSLELSDSDRRGPAYNVFINSDGNFCIMESCKVCICHEIKGGQFNSETCMYIWTLLRGMSFRVGGRSVCVVFEI